MRKDDIYTSPCSIMLFFFNDTATTEIYTLSLHDALPIYDLLARDEQRCHLGAELLRGGGVELEDGTVAEIDHRITLGDREGTLGVRPLCPCPDPPAGGRSGHDRARRARAVPPPPRARSARGHGRGWGHLPGPRGRRQRGGGGVPAPGRRLRKDPRHALRPRPGHRPEPARGGEDGVLSQCSTRTWSSPSSGAGYRGSIASSVSAMVRAITRLRYHLLFAGTTYQGATSVEVLLIASSKAAM